MSYRRTDQPSNLQQLVLRRDTVDHLTKVGWAIDMPLGRFEHIALLAESETCPMLQALPDEHPLSPIYHEACRRAQHINRQCITQQQLELVQTGWKLIQGCYLPQLKGVNFDQADEFGSLRYAAMKMLYQLTANHPWVWCIEHDNHIVQVQSKQVPKKMEELESQIWLHHTISQLEKMPGRLLDGKLVVKESGLWFSDDIE